jgi:hypothetical protein
MSSVASSFGLVAFRVLLPHSLSCEQVFCFLLSCALLLQPAFAQGGEEMPPSGTTDGGSNNGGSNGGGTNNGGSNNGGGGGGNAGGEGGGGGDGGGGGGEPITANNPASSGGPTAASGTFPIWAIIITSAAGGLIVLFLVLKLHNPRANHFDVMLFFLALFDFGADVWFCFTLKDNTSHQTIYKLAIAFTALPFMLNFLSLMYIIRREIVNNLAFRRWLQYNFAPFTAVVLTSCSQMDAMFVLDSHVCGLSCLKAPWSEHMTTLLRMFGFITILFEDIPQACLQIYLISSSSYQLVNILALCSSCITIVFGVTKRMLVCCVYHIEQGDLEAATGTTTMTTATTGGHDPAHTLAKTEGIPVVLKGPVGDTHHTNLARAAALGAVSADDKHNAGLVTRVSPPPSKINLSTGMEEPQRWEEGQTHETNTAIRHASSSSSYHGDARHLNAQGGAGGELSTTHVRLHEPGSAAQTPESGYRRLAPGSRQFDSPAPMAGREGSQQVHSQAAQQPQQQHQLLGAPASVTKVFSSPGSGSVTSQQETGVSPSPAVVAPTSVGANLMAPNSASGSGSKPSSASSSRGSSLDGTEAIAAAGSVPPALPPRPPSANSSPLAPRRQLANSNSAFAPSSHAIQQQQHQFFSPQASRQRTVQPSGGVASASPPIPARPHSATHASRVSSLASAPSPPLAVAAPMSSATPAIPILEGRAPAFTIGAADSLPDLTFHTSNYSSPAFQDKGGLQQLQREQGGKTLADLIRAQ